MAMTYYAADAYQLPCSKTGTILALELINEADCDSWLARQEPHHSAYFKAHHISLKAGMAGLLSDKNGTPQSAYLVISNDILWQAASGAQTLPPYHYEIDETKIDDETSQMVMLGFALASYQPHLKGISDKPSASHASCSTKQPATITEALFEGISLCRDLINAPANMMTPAQLADEATALAHHYNSDITITSGTELETDFPAIHTVGRAAETPPRLIDFSWGDKGPKITLVGKGITFDSGGLDLKPSKAMEIMKKDMGGAAHVLGLAAAIMKAGLPVRLRVLIAAAENAVSEKSMRPMDIINTAAGIKVEVGNTDAEGRLVLADALHLACQDKPDFLLDFATLTGAARVALGTECPALFCNHDSTARQIMDAGHKNGDPVWQLPLFEAYDRFLDQGHMGLSSTGQSGYGGAITAALFLRRFTGRDCNWAHIDVMAWNLASRAGRPRGGEAMGLRACFDYISSLAEADSGSK